MTRRVLLVLPLAVLCWPGNNPVAAFGGRSKGSVSSSSYYAPPAVVVPVAPYRDPGACAAPAGTPAYGAAQVPGRQTQAPPISGNPNYAAPSAAPPSPSGPLQPSTLTPPVPPRISESGPHPAGVAVTMTSEKRATQRCSVAFWNLTDRPLTLTIDGQSKVIERSRSTTLDLPRQFVWQIDNRERQVETIPPSESALEVVIRR